MNFFFPFQRNFDRYSPKDIDIETKNIPTIMICVDVENSILTSYFLVSGNDTYIVFSNEIFMPDVNFINFSYDLESRILYGVAVSPKIVKTDEIDSTLINYELHLFGIQAAITWRRKLDFTRG